MSDLICTVCDHEVPECRCPDRDVIKELRDLSGPGGLIVARWCSKCDNHYDLCRCDKPVWMARSNGILSPLPDGFEAPDLSGGHPA